MRKKHIIRTFMVILAISAAILTFAALRSPKSPAVDSSCKESVDDCDRQQGGKTIMENLSNQFFSSI